MTRKYFPRRLFVVAFALLATVTSYANSACEFEPCKSLQIVYIHQDQGGARYLKYDDAIKQCEKLGLRLPTVREFALFAVDLGAAKIIKYNKSKKNPKGYHADPILALNIDGTEESFYQTAKAGYQRPVGIIGDNWFWTSSFPLGDTKNAYMFNGGAGGIGYDETGTFDTAAVICVSAP